MDWLFQHPLYFLLQMSFIATLLAALAWGRRGIVVGIAAAPTWAILSTVVQVLMSKPTNVPLEFDRLQPLPIIKAMALATAAWLLAAIPGLIMGLAIRALKRASLKFKGDPAG